MKCNAMQYTTCSCRCRPLVDFINAGDETSQLVELAIVDGVADNENRRNQEGQVGNVEEIHLGT